MYFKLNNYLTNVLFDFGQFYIACIHVRGFELDASIYKFTNDIILQRIKV